MKKLIAVSSLLALVLAGSGLFALDIPVGDGPGKFVLDMQAEYEFDFITDTSKSSDNDKNWIEELDADKQGKISVAASYDGDNYAFGVGGGFRQKRATDEVSNDGAGGDKEWYLDDAWGKYYLLDKQLWLRGGSMDGLWRIDTDPLNKNYGGDNGPGLQINFAPSALKGLNVGVALPVPKAGTRKVHAGSPGTDEKVTWTDDGNGRVDNGELTFVDAVPSIPPVPGNWGPTYPLVNAAFGLRLNGTIPNLDIGTELDLLGNEDTNGKVGTSDEGEGKFKGMNFHFTAVYTFAPVTVKAALLVEGIADGRDYVAPASKPETTTSFGARVIFDIPNAEGSSLDLGDPWVQFQMLPNANTTDKGTAVKTESFKDMLIDFEWEPSYSLVPDQIKALLWLGVNYRSWAYKTDDQEKYPLTVAVRPAVEFKFAPNATLKFQDKISFVRQATEKGLKNELGFRFAWKF
ncbi:MAG: hypothetical protein LBJ41_10805 [Treponema sp.]|jgi:hypothetical protein|nr:hypothetical protein [Treponema sp.]